MKKKKLRLKSSVKRVLFSICSISIFVLLFSQVQAEALETVNTDTSNILSARILKKSPTIKTSSDTYTVNKDSSPNLVSFISKVDNVDSVLPYLDIDSNLDTSKEGEYEVVYTVINRLGKSSSKTITVEVKEHEELIEQEYEEFSQLVNSYNLNSLTRFDTNIKNELLVKYDELSDRAKKYITNELDIINEIDNTVKLREQEYQEELKKAQTRNTTTSSSSSSYNAPSTSGGANPYRGGWANCTWGAWQLVYDNLGVSLPAWGNAGDWYARATSSGWATGSTPKVGAVVVSTNHVAYVADVSADGNSIYVKEGNFEGHYHEGWAISSGCNGQCVLGYIYP